MHAIIYTSIKNNRIKLKNEVGMAGSKSTQTRDNRIYYTSLRLLFSTIMHLLMSTCLLSAVAMWEIFRLFPSCHNGLSLSVLIQSHYYWLFLYPSKSNRIRMYTRYDYLLFVYFLILPSLLHSSILFDCFLYLFLFFF